LKHGKRCSCIIEAVALHLITPDMGKWVHQVRLDANDKRRVDDDAPRPTEKEAERSFSLAVAVEYPAIGRPQKLY
jgi:hypothetical protein